jgi:hypothetical protein
MGNLFHNDLLVRGTITSTENTFAKCYICSKGAVWYLTDLIDLTDTASNYYQIGTIEGTIYCDACTLTVTDSIF